MNTTNTLIQLFNLLKSKNEIFRQYKLNEISETPLNELGMDSLGLVTFMVNIEDEFGIEWDEDKTCTEVLRSLLSISTYISEELKYAV